MPITKQPQEAVKFEIQTYRRPKDLKALRSTHVAFSGSPQRHPYDREKIILVADPYETDPDDPGIPDGKMLIIPGGKRALVDWGPPAISRDNPASAAYYGPGHCGEIYEGPVGDGVFAWPTPATYLSGFPYDPNIHPAIDIGGAEGNAVFATDSGVVVYVGWSNRCCPGNRNC